jgi:hypothetical protein
MISHETSDGKLDLLYNGKLEMKYTSYATGAEYNRIYEESDIATIHPLFNLDPSLVGDYIAELKATIDVKDDKTTASYTVTHARRTYNFALVAFCQTQEGTDQDVVNLKRQNRVLSNKIHSIQEKLDKLILFVARREWNAPFYGAPCTIDSKAYTALNEIINIDKVSIGDCNQMLYIMMLSRDIKTIQRAIALNNGNANICNHVGTYAINDHIHQSQYEPVRVEIIQTLIEHKADLNRTYLEKTPLQQCNEQLEAYRKSNNVVAMNDIATVISLLKANGAR